jgi:hypothetical protein
MQEGGGDASSSRSSSTSLSTVQSYSNPAIGHAAQRRGSTVLKCMMVVPTVITWIMLTYAHMWGTVKAVDSVGVTHTLELSRNQNFTDVFFLAAVVSCCNLLGHLWITLSSIAKDTKLAQLGSADGDAYYVRLERAKQSAGTVHKSEWLHIGLLGFDFGFGALVVFHDALTRYYVFGIPVAMIGAAFLPGPMLAVIAKVVANSRRILIARQRANTAVFASSALRAILCILALNLVVLGWSTAWFMQEDIAPLCPYHQNLDAKSNSTFGFLAFVRDCPIDMFKPPLMDTEPNATFVSGHGNGVLTCRHGGFTVLLIYLNVCSVLYYTARGQGILHDRLLIEFEMEWSHVIALVMWLIASGCTLVLTSIAFVGLDEDLLCKAYIGPLGPATFLALLGLCGVLWKDAVVNAIEGLRKGGGTNSKPQGVYDLVFSNKTNLDSLCLAVRSELVDAGLRVWQQ